jgi:hypothetical protein
LWHIFLQKASGLCSCWIFSTIDHWRRFTNDDTCPSQAGSAPPQSPPSSMPTFGIFANTSSMNTWGNTATKLPHTHAANLPGVSGKAVGNKRCRLSGDRNKSWKKYEFNLIWVGMNDYIFFLPPMGNKKQVPHAHMI